MKKVKVNGPAVKLANKWCYIGDEAIIDDEEYNKMKEHVDLIEDIEEPEKEPTIQEEEKSDANPEENPEGNPGGKPEGEDEELEALKERAKELGINVTHNMKKETIIKKIEKAEKAEAGENQNPKGE